MSRSKSQSSAHIPCIVWVWLQLTPSNCGKLTAWNAWDLVPGLTDTLFAIQEDCTTFTRDSVHMQSLERNYILQYCKSSSCSRVNQARVALFKTTRQDTSYTGCTLTAYKESPSTSRLYLEASSEVPTNSSTVYRMRLEARHFRSPHTSVVFAFWHKSYRLTSFPLQLQSLMYREL